MWNDKINGNILEGKINRIKSVLFWSELRDEFLSGSRCLFSDVGFKSQQLYAFCYSVTSHGPALLPYLVNFKWWNIFYQPKIISLVTNQKMRPSSFIFKLKSGLKWLWYMFVISELRCLNQVVNVICCNYNATNTKWS